MSHRGSNREISFVALLTLCVCDAHAYMHVVYTYTYNTQTRCEFREISRRRRRLIYCNSQAAIYIATDNITSVRALIRSIRREKERLSRYGAKNIYI